MLVNEAPQFPVLDESVVEEMKTILEDEYDELVEEYKVDAQQLIDQISTAAEQGDQQSIFAKAHTLGSSSAHMGYMRISKFARHIEALAKNGAEEDYRALVVQLNQHYQELLGILA